MADVTETQLPGVGVRHEFTTADGERVAVLTTAAGGGGFWSLPAKTLMPA